MKDTAEKRSRSPLDQELCARRREQILETDAKLFAKHGYANADTQLLAEELGVGKGTIYRYFPSKEEVFLAAADRVMRMLCEQVDASVQEIEDPLDRIAVAIRSYLSFFAEHPEFVELLMQERAQFKDRKKPTFFVHREARVEQWRAHHRRLIAEGRVRGMPV